GLIGLDEVNRKLGLMITGLDIRYPLGEIAGERVPDHDLPDGTRLYERMHAGRPILLGPNPGPADLQGWADRVDHVEAGTEATLVRPDGYVAWTASMGEAA